MTKETMIWQTLSMIIAGMVKRKEISESLSNKDFECKVIDAASTILAYSRKDIREILKTRDCIGFAKEMSHLYNKVQQK